MTTPDLAQPHAADGDIIRFIDGELATDDAALSAHLASCSECASRVAMGRRHSSLFSNALAALPVASVPSERLWPATDDLALARRRKRRPIWQRTGVRAAAGILLFAGVAAATPMRGWIVARIDELRGVEPATVTLPRSAPPAVQPPATSEPGTAMVGFVPSGTMLSVRLVKVPAAGTLTLIAGSGARVIVRASGITPNESLLVLPNELQVRNVSSSRAHYEITLPPSVTTLQLTVGAAPNASRIIAVTPGMQREVPLIGRAP